MYNNGADGRLARGENTLILRWPFSRFLFTCDDMCLWNVSLESSASPTPDREIAVPYLEWNVPLFT